MSFGGMSEKIAMLKIITPVFIAIVSGCASTPSVENDVCVAFKTWIEAGPRTATHERKLIMPDQSDCYENSGPDEIIFTCLTTNLDCQPGVKCEDAADISFRENLFRPAHYWTEYGYFEVFNICLGTIKKRTSPYSEASKQSQIYSFEKNGIITNLNYDAAHKQVKVIVKYSSSNPN